MTTPFLRVPFVIPGADALTLDPGKVAPMFKAIGPEAGASSHWVFGGGASSLLDLVGGHPLTPLNSAPSHGSVSLTTAASSTLNTGLASPHADAAEQTVIAVFRHRAASVNAGLFGAGGANVADGGHVVLQQGAGTYFNTTRPGTAAAITLPSGVANNDWLFLAISHSALGTAGRRTFVGGADASSFAAVTKAVAGRNIALGNGYLAPASYPTGTEFAEFIVFPTALSEAAMKAVYERSQGRLSPRGVNLF